jgi:hypothetical protein
MSEEVCYCSPRPWTGSEPNLGIEGGAAMASSLRRSEKFKDI